MSQKMCLIGATDKDTFFLRNSEILKNNGYTINLIVSNHTFINYKCSVISYDKIDLKKVVSDNDIIIICESPQCTDAFKINCVILKNYE